VIKAKSKKQKAKMAAPNARTAEHFCFLLFAFCLSPVGVAAA
jgi:nitrate reductase NapE component